MNFVWWVAGLLATVAALRFTILVFKRLTSKENLNAVIDKANDGLHNGAERVANYIRTKKAERDNRPIITIR